MISCYPRFNFTTTLKQGDKKTNTEYEIEAYNLKDAYQIFHKTVESDFPNSTIISICSSRMTNAPI